jgi:signal transduction histidine kinase
MKMTPSHFAKFLPLATFLVFGSIAVFLWQNEISHKRELVFRHTETSAEQIRIRIEGLMKARMASLKLLAERWVERTPPDFSRKRFLEFTEKFYTHYPGFKAINWIDPDGVIQWVFPEEENTNAKGKSAYQHKDSRYRDAFEKAKRDLEFAVTPCIEIYQGGLGFDTFCPLVYAGKVQGYLNGVFQVQLIMDTSLAREILENFWIRLNEQGQLIFHNERQTEMKTHENRVYVLRKIHFPGKTWQLELEPKTRIYPLTAIWNLAFLIFGLAISTAISLLLYFLLQRMEMYRDSRDHALHEVRERKRTEEALRKNEKRLQGLLSQLAAKNMEIESFVYLATHDLKTPIVTIDGFIGALKEDFGDAFSEDGKKYLRYISDAARKMEFLINDLLDLSRIQRPTGKKTEFPFARLVEDALKALQPQIKARGIAVNIQEDLPVIYGERRRLGQVMDNLLTNAIKYIGKENPSPRIDVGVEEQDGQKAFFVRDNGIGIEERNFDKIFQIFQRLPSAKQIGEGTGVGLTIVERIIELHEGKIWLTSETGKGSTFFFSLKDKELEHGL